LIALALCLSVFLVALGMSCCFSKSSISIVFVHLANAKVFLNHFR
jgi:hypothetical protein